MERGWRGDGAEGEDGARVEQGSLLPGAGGEDGEWKGLGQALIFPQWLHRRPDLDYI